MSSSTITQVSSPSQFFGEERWYFYRFLNVILQFGGSAPVLNGVQSDVEYRAVHELPRLWREELWHWNVNIRQQQVSMIRNTRIEARETAVWYARVSLTKGGSRMYLVIFSCRGTRETIKINEACLNSVWKDFIHRVWKKVYSRNPIRISLLNNNKKKRKKWIHIGIYEFVAFDRE